LSVFCSSINFAVCDACNILLLMFVLFLLLCRQQVLADDL
jgi:hypothetical protein